MTYSTPNPEFFVAQRPGALTYLWLTAHVGAWRDFEFTCGDTKYQASTEVLSDGPGTLHISIAPINEDGNHGTPIVINIHQDDSISDGNGSVLQSIPRETDTILRAMYREAMKLNTTVGQTLATMHWDALSALDTLAAE
jgi:hypothetical protein